MMNPFSVHAQGISNLEGSGCMVDGVPTLKCFDVIFGNVLILSSGLVVIILFIMFVIGSFLWMTSLGNAEKIKKARGTLTFAIIGTVLFVGAYLILNIIDILFLGGKGDIFNFSIPEF